MNYTQAIDNTAVTLVEYYATWCSHCRKMMPVVAGIKENLSGKAGIIQIDVDKNQKMSDDAGVEAYPTFILYKNGKEMWRDSGEINGSVLLTKVLSYM